MVPGSVYCRACDRVSIAGLGHPQQSAGSNVFILAPIPVFLMAAVWDSAHKQKVVRQRLNPILGMRKPLISHWWLVLLILFGFMITPIYTLGGAWQIVVNISFPVIGLSLFVYVLVANTKVDVERKRRLTMAQTAYGRRLT
jgi:hypothetical protein